MTENSTRPESDVSRRQRHTVIWQTGFRPFFVGAALWAVVSMLLWYGVLNLNWRFAHAGLPVTLWHAHEMVYGYGTAVIAGFVLTAIPNLTDTRPVSGLRLACVFGAWLIARVVAWVGPSELLVLACIADMVFILGLFLCVAIAVIDKRQFKQSGILAKIALLGVGNLVFYLGAMNVVDNGMLFGLYAGFYLIIALILTMARRLIPFFMQRRLALAAPIRNRKWVDRGSLVLFVMFWVAEVLAPSTQYGTALALPLCVLHAVRLYDWHRPGIWTDPLLWVLYVSYVFIVTGFALKGVMLAGLSYSPSLPFHLLAVGGVGLISCGMMSRISLGHTGRDIRKSPPLMIAAFLSIAFSALVRSIFPIFFTDRYGLFISVSQWLWICGFVIFAVIYVPILLRPRLDGKPG